MTQDEVETPPEQGAREPEDDGPSWGVIFLVLIGTVVTAGFRASEWGTQVFGVLCGLVLGSIGGVYVHLWRRLVDAPAVREIVSLLWTVAWWFGTWWAMGYLAAPF